MYFLNSTHLWLAIRKLFLNTLKYHNNFYSFIHLYNHTFALTTAYIGTTVIYSLHVLIQPSFNTYICATILVSFHCTTTVYPCIHFCKHPSILTSNWIGNHSYTFHSVHPTFFTPSTSLVLPLIISSSAHANRIR